MKTITFNMSLAGMQGEKEETYTLEDLGLDENMSEEEFEKTAQEAFEEWVWENLDTTFWLED